MLVQDRYKENPGINPSQHAGNEKKSYGLGVPDECPSLQGDINNYHRVVRGAKRAVLRSSVRMSGGDKK